MGKVDTGRGDGMPYRIVNERKERQEIPLEQPEKVKPEPEEESVLPPVIGDEIGTQTKE